MEEPFVPEGQDPQNHEEAQPSEEAPVEVDWSKRYNDLRPVYDRMVSDNQRLKDEAQEMRLKALEAQQQAQAIQAQPKQEESVDTFISEGTRTVEKDFPEIFQGVQEHIKYALHRQGSASEDDVKKIQQDAETAKQDAENARLEVEQIRMDSQLSSAMGPNIWPAIDSHQPFRDWVSSDRQRMWQMQMGDSQHKIDCVNNFLATPEGQQFSGTAPQQNVERRQEVQGLMGGQVPANPTNKGNWDRMTTQQQWDSIPEFDVN